MRKAIKAFKRRGLAIVAFDETDVRCRFIRGTPKLAALAEEYLRLLAELGTGHSTAITKMQRLPTEEGDNP